MLNPNWTKWLVASINVHFSTVKGEIPLFIPGKALDIAGKNEWAQLQVVGPNYTPRSKGQYHVQLGISLICASLPNDETYRIHEIAGLFQTGFVDIPVKKYGGDKSEIGCLSLQGEIQTLDWGLVSTDILTRQVNIEASYEMDLQE